MKKIEINVTRYPEDCRKIQQVLKAYDYEASLGDCEVLWQKYSDSMCAGWMHLPDTDDEIFYCINSYIEN